jgi:hypothetical protein
MARPKSTDITRSARVNLALLPEMKKKLEDIASVDELSVNALVEHLIDEYIETRTGDLIALRQFRQQIRREKISSESDNQTAEI